MGNQIRLVFHIQKTDSGYTATLDSPGQGAMGIPFTSVEFSDDTLTMRATNIGAFYRGVPAADSIAGTWSQFFFNHDPAEELGKITIPFLSLIRSNAVQVPPKINHPPIREALQKTANENFTIKELSRLSHMFQESEAGSIMEYAQIEQTFSPVALREISEWIKSIIQ